MGLEPPPCGRMMAAGEGSVLDGARPGSTAVGLEPPSREHAVATGGLTAVRREAQRWARGLPLLADVADRAVEALEDPVDHVEVRAAVDGVAWLVMMSMRGLSWGPNSMVRLCSWGSPCRHKSSEVATWERLWIEAKMAH